MPEFQMPLGDQTDRFRVDRFENLLPFVRGYIEAMFFTSTGSGDDEEMEDATFSDLADETLEAIKTACITFQDENAALLAAAYERDGYDEEAAGRDYWYTRNGHGVDFWDRDELEADGLGEALSERCRWQQINPYRGDDGLVYLA